jgi:hypothetical protein
VRSHLAHYRIAWPGVMATVRGCPNDDCHVGSLKDARGRLGRPQRHRRRRGHAAFGGARPATGRRRHCRHRTTARLGCSARASRARDPHPRTMIARSVCPPAPRSSPAGAQRVTRILSRVEAGSRRHPPHDDCNGPACERARPDVAVAVDLAEQRAVRDAGRVEPGRSHSLSFSWTIGVLRHSR